MKIVTISDTHNAHKELRGEFELPDGDLLIHAGDFTMYGYKHEVESFFSFLKKQVHKYKYGIVFIAGNHDRSFDPKYFREYEDYDQFSKHIVPNKPFWLQNLIKGLPDNIHYLENSSIEINGVNIWGSPITPWFFGDRWAFNSPRHEIEKYWETIPNNTDIIVTHGPCFGKLDKVNGGLNVGCETLIQRVEEIQPVLHISGHIHEGYGSSRNETTDFINASFLDERYFNKRVAITYEIYGPNSDYIK